MNHRFDCERDKDTENVTWCQKISPSVDLDWNCHTWIIDFITKRNMMSTSSPSLLNLSWSRSNEAEFCLFTLQRIGEQPGTGFEADTVPDTVPIPNHKDTNKDILVWKLVLYPTSLKLDEISGWVGCRQQLPVLKLTQLNLETTKRQTKPFIMPWGGARVSRRYMVVQKAQKQGLCVC